ncbi:MULTISPECIES: helix-turn-helix domain-containing protein [Bacillus]|uniref:Transcriptional regulator n=2 Tax=Bacillus thuringiensis TaxID=1428 RepID=A0A9X6LF64_BACUH|nr:helix-turn-helix transcriptional regulator [Bacillus thuringiensis]OUB43226.1 transcriptional regulator [Bacillus thuringiensis serovar higo]OUB82571.1 transcriptional regulator [Bacillus thuringiensis serovar medellin]
MTLHQKDVASIRIIREKKEISIQQCSKDLDIPYGVLQAIETGKKSTIASRAIVIAEYFNVPIGELFTPTYYRAKTT